MALLAHISCTPGRRAGSGAELDELYEIKLPSEHARLEYGICDDNIPSKQLSRLSSDR